MKKKRKRNKTNEKRSFAFQDLALLNGMTNFHNKLRRIKFTNCFFNDKTKNDKKRRKHTQTISRIHTFPYILNTQRSIS